MTRTDLMAAVVKAFGSRKITAEAIGCTPQMISLILHGNAPLTDDLASAVVAAMADRAERLDRLAAALEHQMITLPVRSRRGAHRNPQTGMFQ